MDLDVQLLLGLDGLTRRATRLALHVGSVRVRHHACIDFPLPLERAMHCALPLGLVFILPPAPPPRVIGSGNLIYVSLEIEILTFALYSGDFTASKQPSTSSTAELWN